MRADLFFLIPLILLILLIDIYAYSGISQHIKKIKNRKILKSVKVIYWLIPILLSVAFVWFFSSVKGAHSNRRYIHFSWLTGSFVMFYFPKLFYIVFIIIDDIRRLAIKVIQLFSSKTEEFPRNKYPKISRKKFISQIGIIAATLPFISIVFGILKGRYNFNVRYEKIQFPNLPKIFSGLRIVHLSDLHLGSFNRNFDKLNEAIDLINDQKPDIVVFTGDLVNNFADETHGWERVFDRLKAEIGKFSILGNHDYGDYSRWKTNDEKEANFKGIVDAHERLGFELLRNQSILLGPSGDQIAISGVENWGQPPFPQYGDLAKTAKQAENVDFKILLSHDPSHWDQEVIGKTDYDLMLAGHTHGMQFGIEVGNIKWSPAKYKYKRWSGLFKEQNQYMYVNRGLGFIGMPARIGMPPEITVIDLECEE